MEKSLNHHKLHKSLLTKIPQAYILEKRKQIAKFIEFFILKSDTRRWKEGKIKEKLKKNVSKNHN